MQKPLPSKEKPGLQPFFATGKSPDQGVQALLKNAVRKIFPLRLDRPFKQIENRATFFLIDRQASAGRQG